MGRTAISMLACLAAGCGGLEGASSVSDSAPIDAGSIDGGANGDDTQGFDLGVSMPDTNDTPDCVDADKLQIDPTHATLFIDDAVTPPTPATQVFTAKIERCDGAVKDVTGEVNLWVTDTTLGTFKANVFTSVSSIVPVGSVAAEEILVAGFAEGLNGKAVLTLVQMRASGDHRDLLFIVPYLAAPIADHGDVLKVDLPASATGDVTTVVSNDPSNPPGPSGAPVDATQFIKSLRAMDEGSTTEGCPEHAAKDTDGDGVKDTFLGYGAPLCFEIDVQMNTTVPELPALRSYVAFVDIVGEPGGVALDRRRVVFLVPAF